MLTQRPTLSDIKDARIRTESVVRNTPILTSEYFNDLLGMELFFKCENFQKAGSFKIRGATNTVELLSDAEFNKGVATTSSGNHGAALSMAVSRRGGSTKVVMPHNTPKIKVNNVKRNGGEVIWCDPDQKFRERVLRDVVGKTGATVVHPYNDERIISGQGTCAKEMIEDVPILDCIVSPVSGGGLLGGTLIAAKNMKNSIKVFGAEPEEADDAYQSLKSGKIIPNKTINTVCDGLRAEIGSKTFPIIQSLVDEIMPISESDIVDSLQMIWERMKIIVEPSCSISLALILKNKSIFKDKNVGLIMSGGNIDLNNLPWKS